MCVDARKEKARKDDGREGDPRLQLGTHELPQDTPGQRGRDTLGGHSDCHRA